MSKLAYSGRPWVEFDPKNKDHRKWFLQFKQCGTWGKCPVRFIMEEHGDLVSLIHNKLTTYYMEREFKA